MKDVIITKGAVQITIATTKIEKIINKVLAKITPPKSSQQWAGGPNATRIVDLLRMEKRLNIDGYLDTDYGIGDTSSAAKDKRDDLEGVNEAGGVFTLTNDSVSITGTFEKLLINEIQQDEGTTTKFFVKFTFLFGENI